VLGFGTLHELDPDEIGDCLDEQSFDAAGDAEQHTTKGLLLWRKTENWTGFSDGYRTEINGPTGLVERLNTERYIWEPDAGSPGTTLLAEVELGRD